MKKQSFLLSFYIFFVGNLCAKNSVTATSLNLTAATEWATTILAKVAYAKGDERKTLPVIKIEVPKTGDMACFIDTTNMIYLHPKLISVCQSFGSLQDDALAFVLGHELTHFYQESTWDAIGFASIYFAGEQRLTPDLFKKEEEADIYGAFLAHLAGYNVQKVIPNLLDALYETFHLKGKKIVGSDLEVRQMAVARICAAIERIIRIYDAGNYFLALGEYEIALIAYEELLEQFETKELLNNAGLAAVTAVIASHPESFPLRYPLTLDLSFSLKNRGTSNTMKTLLKKAENYLIRATYLSPDYINAFLNLVSVYDIKGDKMAAKELLTAIRPIAVKNEFAFTQLQILEGIVAYTGEKMMDKTIFTTLMGQHLPIQFSEIIAWNSEVVAGKQMFIDGGHNSPEIVDEIAGVDIFDYTLKPDQVVLNREIDGLAIVLSYEWQPTYEFIEYASANLSLRIQKTQNFPANYGKTLAQVKRALEQETYLITPHTFGVFYTFPKKGLIFNFEKNGHLKEWGIFIR